MVTIKKGDLLNATEKIIAHQVNCQGVAGGLAAHIFRKYPYAENDYYQVIERIRSVGGQGYSLLGLSQVTGQQRDGHIIANLFGQFYPGQDYRPLHLRNALTELSEQARTLEASVALPYKLSCGICGGDWNEVLKIIEETMGGVDCVIYQRDGDE